jgi:hypothetical protein
VFGVTKGLIAGGFQKSLFPPCHSPQYVSRASPDLKGVRRRATELEAYEAMKRTVEEWTAGRQ